jgi:protein-S-isoprenylcysteine O-methyltransferase Ste14
LLGLLLQVIAPLPRISPALSPSLAGVLALTGILLFVGSLRKFWSAGTHARHTMPTTTVVTSGPYRFTRNPMYLAVLCLYLALACWLRLLWPIVLSPAIVWLLTVLVIRPEEDYLALKFGDEYAVYRARVRRWV